MIHDEHPYRDAPEQQDPARRFRGRLAAPVTIVTAGDGADRTGLTVSSLFVVEGTSPALHLVVGPTTDLWETLGATGRMVVHIARAGHEHLSEVFAGLRPSPGGVFAGVPTGTSEWGPVLEELPDRAFCSVQDRREVGYSGIVACRIDRVEVTDLANPLVHFRSRYHRLA